MNSHTDIEEIRKKRRDISNRYNPEYGEYKGYSEEKCQQIVNYLNKKPEYQKLIENGGEFHIEQLNSYTAREYGFNQTPFTEDEIRSYISSKAPLRFRSRIPGQTLASEIRCKELYRLFDRDIHCHSEAGYAFLSPAFLKEIVNEMENAEKEKLADSTAANLVSNEKEAKSETITSPAVTLIVNPVSAPIPEPIVLPQTAAPSITTLLPPASFQTATGDASDIPPLTSSQNEFNNAWNAAKQASQQTSTTAVVQQSLAQTPSDNQPATSSYDQAWQDAELYQRLEDAASAQKLESSDTKKEAPLGKTASWDDQIPFSEDEEKSFNNADIAEALNMPEQSLQLIKDIQRQEKLATTLSSQQPKTQSNQPTQDQKTPHHRAHDRAETTTSQLNFGYSQGAQKTKMQIHKIKGPGDNRPSLWKHPVSTEDTQSKRLQQANRGIRISGL